MIAWLVLTPQRLLSASFADLFISVNLLKLFVRWMNEFMVQSTPALRTPRGGGYSHTLAIRVCAAQRGRDFEAPDLERGIHFRGVF